MNPDFPTPRRNARTLADLSKGTLTISLCTAARSVIVKRLCNPSHKYKFAQQRALRTNGSSTVLRFSLREPRVSSMPLARRLTQIPVVIGRLVSENS